MTDSSTQNTCPAYIASLDADDPLAHCRERFQLPPGVIYLDGNSLGALPGRCRRAWLKPSRKSGAWA